MGDSELKRYFEQLSGAYRNKDGGAMVQLLQAEVAGHPGGSALAAFVGGGVDLKAAALASLAGAAASSGEQELHSHQASSASRM